MNVEVRNNPAEYRYEGWADGELAGYTQYILDRGRIAFLHTEVYEAFEGMGLGGRLARAALDDARARRLVVVPYCPFIADYIERHLDEYHDLVAPEMLSGDSASCAPYGREAPRRASAGGWLLRCCAI